MGMPGCGYISLVLFGHGTQDIVLYNRDPQCNGALCTERVEVASMTFGVSWFHQTAIYCHPSPALRTNILALFTNARISSSNELRSCSGTLGSPRLAAADTRKAGLAISISNSCNTSGYKRWCEEMCTTRCKRLTGPPEV
jgi:hypothetical protein